MPSTPVYLLPYPVGTDPADGPLGFQNLANQTEFVLINQIVAPLDARLDTVEGKLIGVSNDGAGNITLSGKLTVSYPAASGANVMNALVLNDSLWVHNDLRVYGDPAKPTTTLTVEESQVGFFGVTPALQYDGTSLHNAIGNLSGSVKTGLNEVYLCLKSYGLMK